MNAHFAYISILMVVVGFVFYLKNELDVSYDGLEALKRSQAEEQTNFKQKLKFVDSSFEKCKTKLQDVEQKHKSELESLIKKVAEGKQALEKCSHDKQSMEQSLKKVQTSLDALQHERSHSEGELASCRGEKDHLISKINEDSQKYETCMSTSTQCAADKSHLQNEHEKLRVQLQESAAACDGAKNNEAQLTNNLRECQQKANVLQDNVNQQSQAATSCIDQKQKCEAEKQTCLHAAEQQAAQLQTFSDQLQAQKAAAERAAAAQQEAEARATAAQQAAAEQAAAAQQAAAERAAAAQRAADERAAAERAAAERAVAERAAAERAAAERAAAERAAAEEAKRVAAEQQAAAEQAAKKPAA